MVKETTNESTKTFRNEEVQMCGPEVPKMQKRNVVDLGLLTDDRKEAARV